MNSPACPDQRTDCRFSQTGETSTAMNSPVQFDRSGVPVAGGLNTVAVTVKCHACGREWACSQTELAWAQGAEPNWILLA